MTTKAVANVRVPDGKYKGVWGGYVATAVIGDSRVQFWTDIGIRSPATPCEIEVSGSSITVKVLVEA